MEKADLKKPQIERRSPSAVMQLARMGSMHQTRLSFMRVLLRRLARERWTIARTHWQMDKSGIGFGVYTASGPNASYSLIVFSNDLDPAKRSDRVIAEEWDATFTLFDGVPTELDIDRLSKNVPNQEAGRISERELSLSRANRSVRLFDYVRKELAAGRQPDHTELEQVGYLMRTTAVYGSGKFGALDRRFIADRPEMASPFQCELLAVYMIRIFSVDIVEHLAHCDSPSTAIQLDLNLRRSLGIGNSTGLGMAPFIVNHPVLFNQWMLAREEALYRVRNVEQFDQSKLELLCSLVSRQRAGVDNWNSEHPLQIEKISALKNDLRLLSEELDSNAGLPDSHTWDNLYLGAEEHLSIEGQECLVTLLIELYPDLVDDLAATMSVDENRYFKIDGQMSVKSLCDLIEQRYQFALKTDFNSNSANARYWYASEEKLEPRLGERFEEPGAEREHPLAVARDIVAAYAVLKKLSGTESTAEFLLQYPQHRHTVRRAQQSAAHPYSEIANNLIASDMLPIDLLRCKLSYFGAIKFDPRSDRWLRINMFQHAPLPDELLVNYNDTWVYPSAGECASVALDA